MQQVKSGSNHLTSADVKPLKSYIYESPQTTHFSIVDAAGNAVSNTYTLNSSFGSKVAAKGTGILMNNEMDDFSIKPGVPNTYGLVGNEKNSIYPGKRMLSSMTPTIVLKNGKPFFVVGSPGGSTIITVVAHAIIRLIDYGYDVDHAVNLPRVHHQWLPDEIRYEEGAISYDAMAILMGYGYRFKKKKVIGDCHGIVITDHGFEVGVSNRGNGSAQVY